MAHNYVIKFGLLLNFILDIFCALEEGLVRSTCIAVQSKIVESALCNAHLCSEPEGFFHQAFCNSCFIWWDNFNGLCEHFPT